MTAAVVNTAGNSATTTSNTLAVTIPLPTGGNLLIVTSSAWASVSSISGGGVTTWTNITPPGNASFAGDSNHNNQDIWCGTVDGTPGTTITITYASSVGWRSAHVIEASGVQKAVDVSVSFANDAQGSSDSKAISTLTDGDLIVSVIGVASGATGATAPVGYTAVAARVGGGNVLGTAYLVQGAHGSSTMNWTAFGNSGAFPSLGAVAIKAAGGVAAPTNSVAPSVTGTTIQGSTLTTTNGTWTGSPTGFTYQWQRDSAGNGVFSSIASATSSTYALQAADVGNKVRCVVTATNTGGSTAANSNAVGPITSGPTPPTNTVAPSVTGTPRKGQTLSASTGTWTDSGAPTFTYQWQRDNSGGGTYSNIASATASTYTLVAADVGCNIRCVVTDTDANGSTSANSNSLTIGDLIQSSPSGGIEECGNAVVTLQTLGATYTDTATVSGAAAISAIENVQYIDQATPSGHAVISAVENTQYIDAAMVTAVSVITGTDALLQPGDDVATVTGTAVITATEVTDYADAAVVIGSGFASAIESGPGVTIKTTRHNRIRRNPRGLSAFKRSWWF